MTAKVVPQISFYIKNEPGSLGDVCRKLADGGVNIVGIQTVQGQLEQLIRFAPNAPDLAEKILRDMGVDILSREHVVQVPLGKERGVLASVAEKLGKAGINIDSFYATEAVDTSSMVYFNTADPERAVTILNEAS